MLVNINSITVIPNYVGSNIQYEPVSQQNIPAEKVSVSVRDSKNAEELKTLKAQIIVLERNVKNMPMKFYRG